MMKLPAASCSRRRSAGFTLIELMVVALIIGITLTFVVVSFDRDVDDEVQIEAQRLGSLVTLAAQESVLHGREHALEFGFDSYKFLILNEESNQWQSLDDDNMLRERQLPKGITLELYLEGHDFDFEDGAEAAADGDEETESVGSGPRVFMLSSGEMSPFEAELRHEDGEVRFVVKAGITGKVEIERE